MDALTQPEGGKEILQLSLEKFQWKTTGRFDLLFNLFDHELIFFHIKGAYHYEGRLNKSSNEWKICVQQN